MKAPRRERRGFTLLELMISVALMALMVSSVALLGVSNRRAFEQGAASADVEAQLHRTVDRVTRELMRTSSSVLVPDPAGVGADDLDYQKATGIAGGMTSWSTPFRIWWEYEEGEVDDGVDNNGNGLVDEGRLMWTRDVGGLNEQTIELCGYVAEYLEGETGNGVDDNGNGLVDERGFCIERVGDVLIVRMTLRRVLADAGVQSRTMETSIRLRNG